MMNKILSILIALSILMVSLPITLTTASAATGQSEALIKYGDANESGEVNIFDALATLKQSVGSISMKNSQLVKSDVNNDGSVTAMDALLCLQYSAELIDTFPATNANKAYLNGVLSKNFSSPKLVVTKYYTDTAIVADVDVFAFGAVGNGSTDDTTAFQNALNHVSSIGGGTVYVPEGRYRIASSLTIPKGVSLVGDAPAITDGAAGAVKGTVLYAYSKTDYFLKMYEGAAVHNLSIFYPEQNPSSISAYPYTIKQMSTYGISVKNVNLVNSYNGICMGPEYNTLSNIVNVTGTVMGTGIFLDNNWDICRIENLHFGPEYWQNSGLTSFSSSTLSTLTNYMKTNTVGLDLQRIDWTYISDIWLNTMKTAVWFRKGTDGGCPNGQVYNFYIWNSNEGFRCDNIAQYGMELTKGQITASTPITCAPSFDASLTVNSVTLETTNLYAYYNAGNSRATFERCTFKKNSSASATAIYLVSGSVAVNNCTSSNFDTDVYFSSNATSSKLVNFNTSSTLKLGGTTARASKVFDGGYVSPAYTELDYRQQTITRPSGSAFINLNAYSNGSDDASRLQNAINEVYAQGGGVVYLPAQNANDPWNHAYWIGSNITVKPGVEIRGSWNAPCHSMVSGTVVYTALGQGNANGTPLFTLQAKAGLSGFKMVHQSQYQNKTFHAFPYMARGAGMCVYVNNVCGVNSYNGIDFSTNKCDGHVINGYNGTPLKNGITVGGGSVNGIVKNCQLLCHYFSTSSNLFEFEADTAKFGSIITEYERANLETFVIKNTKDQIFFNNFTFGALSGFVFDSGADAFVLTQGVDASTNAITARGTPSDKLTMVNTQLVNLGSASTRTYVNIESSFGGDLTMVQTNMWGLPTTGILARAGKFTMSQGTMQECGTYGVNVSGSTKFQLSGMCFRDADTNYFVYSSNSNANLTVFGNRYAKSSNLAAIITSGTSKSTDW
ncbi:MAG: hypothetical protein IJ944_04450 [Clostridia bacterium]|nr:hypothetical protein [Clostridia bacterium]